MILGLNVYFSHENLEVVRCADDTGDIVNVVTVEFNGMGKKKRKETGMDKRDGIDGISMNAGGLELNLFEQCTDEKVR